MTSVTLRKFSGHIAQCRDCEHYHHPGVCKCPKCDERTVKPVYLCKCAHFQICEGQKT